MKILVVDDEQMVRDLMEEVLHISGFESLIAENGSEALDLFEKHKDEIGLAFIDLVLPKMSGLKLCRELKTRKPRMKVVLFSGHADDLLLQRLAQDVRADDHLTKPFKVGKAVSLIRSLLGVRGRSDAARGISL